ncbi:hypothetical protein NFI96_001976 [Prochilodus magdalenae]|nr:hypothetical protein NFI96_001976 [Prochilodus magdalenae]
MLRTVRVNPQTSTKDLQQDLAADGVTVHRSTIRRTLPKEMLNGRVMQRKPFLRPHHKQSHLRCIFWFVCAYYDLDKYYLLILIQPVPTGPLEPGSSLRTFCGSVGTWPGPPSPVFPEPMLQSVLLAADDRLNLVARATGCPLGHREKKAHGNEENHFKF